MKTRRIVYTILGSTLVVINLLIDLFTPLLQESENEPDMPSRIGYIIGTQFILIIGLVFFILTATVSAKIRRKEKKTLRNSIDSIGID